MAFLLTIPAVMLSLAGCSSNQSDGTSSAKLAVAGQSAANSQSKSGEKVTLNLFTGKIETIDVMNDIINAFNKSQGNITVEQEYQKSASDIIKVKFASGDVPDIMTVYEQGYVDEGKYLDLSSQSDWWNRVPSTMKDDCTDTKTGKQYRICTNMTNAGLFYRKDIFQKLGLKQATAWEDFEKNLEAIKEKDPGVTPLFIFGKEAWSLGHYIEFVPHGYIKQTLGTIGARKAFLNNDTSKLNFGASNGCMAVFAKDLLELKNKGLINSDALTATSDNCVQDFVSGKAAMFSDGMWVLSSLKEADANIEKEIGFAPYPSYMPNSKPTVLSAEDSGYSISATTKHKDAAIKFLNYLFKPENQKKYSEVAGAPSAFKDVSASWASSDIVTEVNSALKLAVNIDYTNEKPSGFTGDDAGRLVQDLLSGKYPPKAFAKAYEKAWTDGMK